MESGGRGRKGRAQLLSGGGDAATKALGAGLLASAGVGVQRAALDGLVDQRDEPAVLRTGSIAVTRVHGGLEAPEVRLDCRRVLAILDALPLRAVVALDL